MNPPLREPGANTLLLEQLRQGKIDWIETDHAPHSLSEKTGENERGECASGIPALHAWPLIIDFLESKNFTNKQIDDVTHNNVARRFNLSLQESPTKGEYIRNTYQFEPWAPLEQKLRGNR